jgi:tetratricopeptide (TPR) repeat protein
MQEIKMKNKWLFIFLLFCAAVFIFPDENPWGNLKKIHFYDSIKKYDKVLENLERIDCEGIEREEKAKIALDLIKFGDYYFSKGKYEIAEAFYRKVLCLSPEYWYLYNKLETIDRTKGRSFISFKNVFRQLGMILKDFKSSFLLFNGFFNMIFFAGLFVFFLFSIILFIRYFKLAGNDLLIDAYGNFLMKKLIFTILILLWPLLVLSGWMIYPFLITGFLWVYLNENEKKAISYFLILLVILAALYGMNLMLERSARDENFKIIQRVYNGHLFEREDYQKFDNELKVAQAFSYYENKQYGAALEILLSTSEEYKNKLKYDLIGNIYYKSADFNESINYYNESLRLDDKDNITLNNFTLSLLKNGDESVFSSYAQRYPEIDDYKKTVSTLKEVKIFPASFLWKRLLSFSSEHFRLERFLRGLLIEFMKCPIIYYILVFIIYIFGIKRFSPVLGGSTYCTKCSRIIKEASIHKSYKLCDECYQLFMIKDVIFLEAKILKEKELRKKFNKKYAIGLIFSFLIPGLTLNLKERNRLFILLSIIFYLLFGFSIFSAFIFTEIFLTAPMILNLIGMLAVIFYFLINLFSVLGGYDGF